MRKQLRLSGSGGQGVITAAILLATAAVAEGKEAVQSQSYGPEARGGASKSEVIIDDGPIYHPHVETPDVVLSLTQKAADKYYQDLNPEGLLILDEELVPEPPAFPRTVRVPFTKLAVEKLGKKLYTNIIALGALVHLTGIVSRESIEEAVKNRFPAAFAEGNLKALQIGWDAVTPE